MCELRRMLNKAAKTLWWDLRKSSRLTVENPLFGPRYELQRYVIGKEVPVIITPSCPVYLLNYVFFVLRADSGYISVLCVCRQLIPGNMFGDTHKAIFLFYKTPVPVLRPT